MSMALTTARVLDEYLVASIKAGNRQAKELLARRWQRKLIAHAWRLVGDIEAAQDAAQAAWGEIFSGLHRLEDERAFPAWAYRIVSRVCAKQIGGVIRQRELAHTLASQPVDERADLDASVDANRLRAAIRELPASHRSAIALFHFEGLSVAEVAVALHVPPGTVKTRLMHARQKLRAVLEGEK